MTVNVKQNMITLTNSGMGKSKISLLKCFSLLAFKSRQKIHSSLKNDGLTVRPTKVHTGNILPITLLSENWNEHNTVSPSNSLQVAVRANSANRLGAAAFTQTITKTE